MSNDGRGSVAERLLALGEARATGTLALWRGQVGKQLFIREGQLVGAESNLREEALGEVLIGLGILGKSKLPRLLAEVRRRGQKMGAVLVELGWASPETVLQALGEQVRIRARACLRWHENESRFDPTETFVGQILEYPSPLASLVFSGLRAQPSFDRLVPALDASSPLTVNASPAWATHRATFNEIFGKTLDEQIAAGIALQSLAVHPEAGQLLEGLDVLLASGLAELRGDEGPFVVPEPPPIEGASVPLWAGPVRPDPAPTASADRLDAELAFTDGKAPFSSDDFAAAVAHFQRAVALRADQSAYHAWLGWTLYRWHGEAALPRVLASLHQSVDIDPDADEGNAWLGEVLLASDSPRTARPHLERALSRRPDRPDLVAALVKMHVDAGEPAQAERVYWRVITALGDREPILRARLWRAVARLCRESLDDQAGGARADAAAEGLESAAGGIQTAAETEK